MPVNKKSMIFWGITFVVIAAIGFYAGYKWGPGPDPVPIDMHKIDSLNHIVLTLEDSLRTIQNKTETITKVIYKYRTKYDTISLRTDSREIVESLRKIAAKPIK